MSDDVTALPLDALRVDHGVRPKAPRIEAATDMDRAAGRQLAAIHRHYLMELAKITRLMERIEAGDAPPEALADIVLHSDMSRNLSAFGTICGQACHMLMMHHNISVSTNWGRPNRTSSGKVPSGSSFRCRASTIRND